MTPPKKGGDRAEAEHECPTCGTRSWSPLCLVCASNEDDE